MGDEARVVVCGAGIAGVSTAFHLATGGMGDIVLVDPLPPLTLTSDKSTECYRNWWPSPEMVVLMNRSIDLLERYSDESGDAFAMNRRGYLFVTGDEDELGRMAGTAAATADLGAGRLRVHDRSTAGYVAHGDAGAPADGADLLIGSAQVHAAFPYLAPEAVGALHVRRAGWLSAQQLGAWMLDRFFAAGGVLVRGRVTAVEVAGGRVVSVRVDGDRSIRTAAFVNAAGPLLQDVGDLVGVDLAVHSEVHQKVALRDHRGAFPRDAPMLIWADEQLLAWTEDERAELLRQDRGDLAATMPRFCHGRPEGGGGSQWALGLWEWRRDVRRPSWPLPADPLYPEVVVRGLATMLPAMAAYTTGLPETSVDGGYYTKTVENRPLAGPAGPDGSFVCGAMSGFGVMASAALGELTAAHVTGSLLPDHAAAFALDRYDDRRYLARIAAERESGQL